MRMRPLLLACVLVIGGLASTSYSAEPLKIQMEEMEGLTEDELKALVLEVGGLHDELVKLHTATEEALVQSLKAIQAMEREREARKAEAQAMVAACEAELDTCIKPRPVWNTTKLGIAFGVGLGAGCVVRD